MIGPLLVHPELSLPGELHPLLGDDDWLVLARVFLQQVVLQQWLAVWAVEGQVLVDVEGSDVQVLIYGAADVVPGPHDGEVDARRGQQAVALEWSSVLTLTAAFIFLLFHFFYS